MHSLIPVSVEGQHLGDLISGAHGVTFYSVRSDLVQFDGRTFPSIQDARSTLRSALWGKPKALKEQRDEGDHEEPSSPFATG